MTQFVKDLYPVKEEEYFSENLSSSDDELEHGSPSSLPMINTPGIILQGIKAKFSGECQSALTPKPSSLL